ncbi:hypothetical protein PMZ80_009609 [Knufia obscura]|uniref:XRCC4 coiled-coil domain-containing protein n=1 Tax=Knufia obscura TaxID=1635080 RepID=A0ABR0RBN6_9EURO|nr:hypothetical protein PMZ80_009609 [Knufia obscura]
MESWTIKLPQADKAEDPILIHVSRKHGGKTLDLDLLATDGEQAWRTQVRERKLDIYRAENYEGTSGEWSSILQYAFIFSPDVVLPSAIRDSLEIVCKRSGKSSKPGLTITLRTRVEDIERRLGRVELSFTEDTDDVDIFGWTSQAIQTRDDISARLSERQSSLEEAQKEIGSLKKRLEELIVAKEEHESQLLAKFALLLNEKKLRIRTQQRQIAEADRPARRDASTKTSKVSRKRKQDPKKQDSDTGEESEGFEAMDLDNTLENMEEQESDQAQATPSDTETDTDEDAAPNQRPPIISKQQDEKSSSATPPPRNLPFSNKPRGIVAEAGKPTDTSMAGTAEDDDETASEDDEL